MTRAEITECPYGGSSPAGRTNLWIEEEMNWLDAIHDHLKANGWGGDIIACTHPLSVMSAEFTDDNKSPCKTHSWTAWTTERVIFPCLDGPFYVNSAPRYFELSLAVSMDEPWNP